MASYKVINVCELMLANNQISVQTRKNCVIIIAHGWIMYDYGV